jgi:hypothetical protein
MPRPKNHLTTTYLNLRPGNFIPRLKNHLTTAFRVPSYISQDDIRQEKRSKQIGIGTRYILNAGPHAASDRCSSMICIAFYKCSHITLNPPTFLLVLQKGLAIHMPLLTLCVVPVSTRLFLHNS